jgi:VWFA-related protein
MTQAISRVVPALLICSAAAAASGQTARPAAERSREVYVSVLDRKGVPVPDVTPADLIVKEDGKVREVLGVRPADKLLQIALLVDDSQAATDSTSYMREGLAALLERLHGKAEIALITIGERPTVVTQYTKDTELLKKATNRLFPRTGAGAYLLDAISDASRGLAKREADRPVILAISFEIGVDYSNRHYTQVLDELMKSGATLHVVAIGSPNASLSDEMRNRNIVIADGTDRTGGRRDQVLALSGIPDKLKQVGDELVNQYVVTYARPDTLVPPEKLEVTSKRPNVTARARTRLLNR